MASIRLRFVCAGLVLCGFLAPSGAAWLILRQAILHRTAAAGKNSLNPSPKTPNPARAPIDYVSPFDQLVYVDPWFAGTIVFWIVPILTLEAALFVFAAALVQRATPERPVPRWRRLSTFVAAALFLGLLLAAPWFYGICQLLTRAG